MKNHTVYFLLIVIALCGCGLSKIDEQKAQTHVENLLNDLKNENYSALANYYTASFNNSEPDEKKIEKYRRLKEVMGAIQSYEFKSAKQSADKDAGFNQLELVYHVKCSKVSVKETFLIINDEGDLKITFQNIENLQP